MTKFIGLICAWAVEDWIELSINQALSFCDEVIVSIGAHCEGLKKYEDKTLEICKSFGDKIKLVDIDYAGRHSTTKARTMNRMLQVSQLNKIGNYVFLLDADEFYHKSDVDKLKEILVMEYYNSAVIKSKIFFINMKNYVEGDHFRVWKITNNECGFQPTNRWTGLMNPQFLSEQIMFHYTFLLNPYAKMDFWKEEYGTSQNNKVEWMENSYLKFNLNKPSNNPTGPHDFGYTNQLLKFNGKHPAIIENSKFINVKDFRTLYTRNT
jgi:hypothetical protein